MDKISFKLLAISYLMTVLGLFFYSFTQVDLNLTLSQASVFQNFQRFFIHIGYFNRPLSTTIFIFLIFLLTACYLLLLWLITHKKITEKQVWLLIILISGILLFSYPAFSYDIFNYMFDARIFTHYGLNPYQYKALDFSTDPWIRFMHWTHRTYPYGPLFLPLSLIPSFLGLGTFILTLFNFKLLAVISFLGSTFLIGKIMEKIEPARKLLAVAFFALNPLIIIETLVSGHNDLFMLTFALISIYFLIFGKKVWSLIFLFASAGIKFVTIVLFPLYLILFMIKQLRWHLFFRAIILFLLLSLIPVIIQREPYPWYFIPVFGIASFLVEDFSVICLTSGLSVGLLLRYAPFLYFGDYEMPVPVLKTWLTVIPLALSLAILMTARFFRKNV